MYNTPRKENIKSRDYHVTPAITTVDKSYNTGDKLDVDDDDDVMEISDDELEVFPPPSEQADIGQDELLATYIDSRGNLWFVDGLYLRGE
mmetsp:Transcript_11768/g.16883  ORF Transcript_11768/g.16883 Transcript_11768/m.16883 type:complete len:90 (+) Transcript_11768:250-519(+)|eukprot:CAMPEP_0201710322 /NCGR_PEP_ID=MMETSP0578-20130828/58568_1 /ASSEMBLY_ACC=CAM_ASM_000663 /TAXON_ID=267565 /ORGANISM="Skeletonema grethea, Strain CCMP 1804" /LENGTH=89 /DNA_ID=CAMNT_0048199351 /DNA_START=186 /DNA_END=455 /DNA_ORIENTATION=-